MALKRYVKYHTEELALQSVITHLEKGQWVAGLRLLLAAGPFLCLHYFQDDDQVSDLGNELLRFVRAIIRTRGKDSDVSLQITGRVQFDVSTRGGIVCCSAEGAFEDLASLQLVGLIQEVGTRSIRRCRDPKCEHIYVKVNKRDYCSTRCQKRDAARRDREAQRQELEELARQQEARKRRRRA